MLHSLLLNSNLRRSFDLSLVISSTALRYSIAASSISNVEFHRVDTSRGISLSVNFSSLSTQRHSGRSRVVELTILKASFRICRVQASVNHKPGTRHCSP